MSSIHSMSSYMPANKLYISHKAIKIQIRRIGMKRKLQKLLLIIIVVLTITNMLCATISMQTTAVPSGNNSRIIR